MSEAPGLARLQAWMQAVITHPCCAAEGLESAEALRHHSEEDLPLLVRGGRGLTAAERLGIYQGMHLPRMRDALESDYPALAQLLGEDGFVSLVRDYVRAFPSVSYTLNRLGDHLPGFLDGWGPVSKRALRGDLARLELAMTEVFDAEETPPLTPGAISRVPPDAWAAARLVPIAALRLVALRTNALATMDALRSGEPIPAPRRRRQDVAVYRRDYAVRRRPLAPAEAALLREVVAGRTLGEAVEALLARRRRLDGGAIASWTSEWVAAGLFTGVAVP